MPQHELFACAQCGCFAFSCFEDFAIRVYYTGLAFPGEPQHVPPVAALVAHFVGERFDQVNAEAAEGSVLDARLELWRRGAKWIEALPVVANLEDDGDIGTLKSIRIESASAYLTTLVMTSSLMSRSSSASSRATPTSPSPVSMVSSAGAIASGRLASSNVRCKSAFISKGHDGDVVGLLSVACKLFHRP